MLWAILTTTPCSFYVGLLNTMARLNIVLDFFGEQASQVPLPEDFCQAVNW
jgi:hypothetical protein